MTNELLIYNAISEIYVKEFPGDLDNPRILQYAKECGFDNYTHDDIAWCSLFMNWVALQAGAKKTNSLMARSWLTVGQPLGIEIAITGDVCIFWRGTPNSAQGHVGLFINKNDTHIRLIGGNQGDEVKIIEMPINQLLGIRRL